MKQGFVIAKNKQNKDFFGGKGSYDRPLWTDKLEEAAVYHSDTAADTAVKKLWNKANFTARIVPLSELEIAFVKPAHDDRGDEHHDDLDHPADPKFDDPDVDSNIDDADGDHDDIDSDHDDIDSDHDDIDSDHEDNPDDVNPDDLDADIDGDMQSDSRMGDEECHCPEREQGRHEEDCEMSRPVVSYTEGEKVMWSGKEAEIIVANHTAKSVVIRVDGADMKVSMESVEAMGLSPNERAMTRSERASMRSGEQEWRDQAAAQSGQPKQIWIKTRNRRYGPYADAGEANKVKLAMGLGMEAQVVAEDFTMPRRPDNQGNAPSDDNNPQIIPNLSQPKVNDISFEDPVGTEHKPETDLDYSGAYQNGEKVKIPPNVLAALRDSIAVFHKAADYNNTRDDAQASFCMTVASAMEELLDHISLGTVDGVKQAQIKMTSWMNPITTNIPPEVRDFVLRGGRQPSLKDMFDMKREEALLNKVRKGLNQKGE